MSRISDKVIPAFPSFSDFGSSSDRIERINKRTSNNETVVSYSKILGTDNQDDG